MIDFLNHKLINSPAPNFPNDLVCINCSVRLEQVIHLEEYNLVLDYIFDIDAGTVYKNYNLSCEEQQIKNLLE